MESLSGKVVVVTGGTGAVGAALVRELRDWGAQVVAPGRAEMDLGDPASIHAAAERIAREHPEIDVLVNNAAVFSATRREVGPRWEAMFGVNHLGPFLLTRLLAEPLRAARGRVITVTAPSTSELDFDDLMGERSFSALTQFGRSKMANLLFAFELARREERIASHAVHPGLVKSQLLREGAWWMRTALGWFSAPPERAAEGVAWMCGEPDLSPKTGGFWHVTKRRAVDPPKAATDREAAAKLWEISERLVR